jgi:hypothetical protein
MTSVVSNCSLQQYRSVDAFFLTKGLGIGAGRRSAPHNKSALSRYAERVEPLSGHSFGVNAGAQLDAAHAYH